MAQERKKGQHPESESLKEREYKDEKGEVHHHTKKKPQQGKTEK